MVDELHDDRVHLGDHVDVAPVLGGPGLEVFVLFGEPHVLGSENTDLFVHLFDARICFGALVCRGLDVMVSLSSPLIELLVALLGVGHVCSLGAPGSRYNAHLLAPLLVGDQGLKPCPTNQLRGFVVDVGGIRKDRGLFTVNFGHYF
jgi:hypothetical protein